MTTTDPGAIDADTRRCILAAALAAQIERYQAQVRFLHAMNERKGGQTEAIAEQRRLAGAAQRMLDEILG